MDNAITSDTVTSPQMMRKLIQGRILALQTKVNAHMGKSRARYKQDYNCRVRKTPTLTKDSYVFIDKPILCVTSDVDADTIAKKEYNKIQSRTMQSFRTISVQKSTVTINDNGIPSTVAIDRVTHAPPSNHNQPQTKIRQLRQRINQITIHPKTTQNILSIASSDTLERAEKPCTLYLGTNLEHPTILWNHQQIYHNIS